MCEIVYNILITNFTVHRCIIRSNAPSNLQMQPLGCIFVYALNCITFGTAIEPEYEKGYFIAPTIFTDTTPEMRIVQEEIFGPVVVIQKFHGEEEAIQLANNTTYGLAAGIFTSDNAKALRVVKKIRAGITWINTYGPVYPEAPWGGYKQSGIGRELGTYGLDDYTEVKQININTNVCPTGWFE